MIQTLPLLPSTYGQWDWAKSNGSASIDQTKLSYQTLLDKGLCSSFSRFVWNDIVDMTANALGAAGIEWDSTYGSADDCKIGQFLGALTASKFNGVALNINIMGLFSWKWAAARNITGYVGRDNFYGVSTHGKNADNLYAWYIIELTKKLNWLIKFLKNESDFSDCQKNLVIESAAPVSLSSIECAPFETSVGDASYGFAGLGKIGVVSTGSKELCRSDSNCILLPNHAVCRPSSDTQIVSESGAKFEGTLPAQYLIHHNQVRSYITAMMDANVLDLFVSLYSVGNYISNLVSLPPEMFSAQQFSESLANPNFVSLPAETISAKAKSESRSFAKLHGQFSLRFDTNSFAETLSSSEITIKAISPIRCVLEDGTISNAVIHAPLAISMPFKTEVCANYIVYGEAYKSAAMKHIEESRLVIVDDIATCPAPAVKSTKYIQARFEAECASAQTKSVGATLYMNGYDSSPELCQCVPAKSVSHNATYSSSDAVIQSGIPLIVDSINESMSGVNGQIVNVPKQILEAKEKSVDRYSAAMCQRSPAVCGVLSISSSSIDASMELEYNTPVIWYDPIQTGNNLYIRSAHPKWQNGTNVHLGINNDTE